MAEWQFERYPFSPIEANTFVCLNGDNAVVVDPNINEQLYTRLEECGVSRILVLLTHEHYDHITGLNDIRSRFETVVVCTKNCADFIAKPSNNRAELFAALMRNIDRATVVEFINSMPNRFSCSADITFTDEIRFSWHGIDIKMIAAPGHSPGSCLIYIGNCIFTGDSWIYGCTAITNMRGGSRAEYEAVTMPMLKSAAEDTMIMAGHGEPFRKGINQPD